MEFDPKATEDHPSAMSKERFHRIGPSGVPLGKGQSASRQGAECLSAGGGVPLGVSARGGVPLVSGFSEGWGRRGDPLGVGVNENIAVFWMI